MDPLAVLDFGTGLDGDDITETNAKVVTHDAIQPDLVVGNCVIRQNDANGLSTLLACQEEDAKNRE